MSKQAQVISVIPARYGSTRFPGKPLALIAGKPMIQWVYERASQTRSDAVIVATDDERIRNCVEGFGGQVAMTSPDHQTGTDRIAEAAAGQDADIVINIQGDEPLIPPTVIDGLITRMLERPEADLGTIAVPFSVEEPAYTDPNVVKVVVDHAQRALYFSRSPLPYYRDGDSQYVAPLRHWGIYAFRQAFLEKFISWPQGNLERSEKLEQLRALENGAQIEVLITQHTSVGVDVPEDIALVEQLLKDNHETR